jgi:hypothetical protein
MAKYLVLRFEDDAKAEELVRQWRDGEANAILQFTDATVLESLPRNPMDTVRDLKRDLEWYNG